MVYSDLFVKAVRLNVVVREGVDMGTVREKCSQILFNLHRLKINVDCLFLYKRQ